MKYPATIIVTIVALTAVLWPGSALPDTGGLPIDKLAHFVIFVTWTVAVVHDFRLKWYTALLAAMLFALGTECLQLGVEGRSFDLNDLIADAAGAVFGVANSSFIIRITKKVLRR